MIERPGQGSSGSSVYDHDIRAASVQRLANFARLVDNYRRIRPLEILGAFVQVSNREHLRPPALATINTYFKVHISTIEGWQLLRSTKGQFQGIRGESDRRRGEILQLTGRVVTHDADGIVQCEAFKQKSFVNLGIFA